MEELSRIREERYRNHLAQKRAIEKLERKQKLESIYQDVTLRRISVLRLKYFGNWVDDYRNPWRVYVRRIVRFLRYVRFWGKSPVIGRNIVIPMESDDEINREIRRDYEESLRRDKAREMIPLIFWLNTRCPLLNDNFTLQDYISRYISVGDFRVVYERWIGSRNLLFWVRVHVNVLVGLPNWVGLSRDYVLKLSMDNIREILPEMNFYERHQCPHCDSMVELLDMVDYNDYKICLCCSALVQRNPGDIYSECLLCSSVGVVRIYNDVPVCELCARQQGIYNELDEEMVVCPGCSRNYVVGQMVRRDSGILFCRDCVAIVEQDFELEEDSE